VKKKILSLLAIVAVQILGISGFSKTNSATAQPIVPANDLGTNVSQQGNRFDIGGGTQAGANLFHSFQQFGLNQGQIANFLSNPNIQNVLSRVVGGDPSVINGVIQLTGGNSNLYIMNPAGIVFGANASLNVPAAFTATTANGIQVGNGWFGANTSMDVVKTLTGTPNGFGFANPTAIAGANTGTNSTGGAIVNAGNLAVKEGQSITLVGGMVINTGTIATPAGKITIAAVENGKFVRVSQAGSLLSLDLPVADNQQLTANSKPLQVTDLPALLAGRPDIVAATGLSLNSLGQVVMPNNVAVPTQTGTAIASGNLNVSASNSNGGTVHVLGTNVGLVGAKINASGATGGGTVLIGGDYQGKGTLPNAQFTYVSRDSTIIADAIHNGKGGLVVAWSDRATRFFGTITAKGGTNSGDGGFVEVSGKNGLDFQGSVNTQAPNGKTGTLLLDPYNLVIDAVGGISLVQAGTLGFGADFTTSTLDVALINGVGAGTTISLQARNNITFNASINNFNDNVNLIANAGNTITLVNGASINLGGANTNVTFTAGGNIAIASQGTGFFDSAIRAGSVSLSSTNGNINTGTIKTENGNAGNANISLSALNGTITLDGFLQAGNVGNGGAGTPLADSKITIAAQSFRAINPLVNNGNYIRIGDVTGFANNGQANPISLIAYSAATVNNFGVPFAGVPTRSVQLTLPGDTSARTIAGSGAPIISITILKDNSFTIFPRPLTSGSSGTDGGITQGVSSIPPNVFILVSDQSFTSNPNLTNASTGVLATTPSDGAVAATRTAEVQTASNNVNICDSDKDKKPVLNVTASLPTPIPGGIDRGSTSGSQGDKRSASGLPPCK
jgi:filamentous hemagglutinin family protein